MRRSTVRAPSTAAVQAIHLIAVHGLCAVVDAAVAQAGNDHGVRPTRPISRDLSANRIFPALQPDAELTG